MRKQKWMWVLFSFTLTACAKDQVVESFDQACSDPRPQMCTMQYDPVCATLSDGSQKTMASDCSACGDETVKGYSKGECQ